MNKILKSLFFCIIFLANSRFAEAQQDAQYSQYMFNSLVINPAYAGYKEALSLGALSRIQWVGIDGAPKTQTIIFDGSFGNDEKVGLGLSIVKDKLGLQEQSSAYLNYAYRLRVGDEARLAFGLGIGVAQYTLNGDGAITNDPNDPNFPYGKASFIVPDARFGVHYSTDQFYAGLSVTNLVSPSINYSNDTKNIVAKQGRHFFLTAGYLVDVLDFVKFKPSFLIKEDLKGPTNLDLNNFFLINEKVWLGFSYRTSVNLLNKSGVQGNVKSPDALVGMVEFYAGKGWRLGYAYDYTVSSLKGYESGSHEISIGITFGKRDVSILSPRYF
jgi:type IX secretion system PorP/SprF family membrane protein